VSGVVSATDHFELLKRGPIGFARLVRSRVAERDIESHSKILESPTRVTSLADELAVRDLRIAELRELSIRRARVEELMGLPGYTAWSPSPSCRGSRSSTPAATAEAIDTWMVTLRPKATPSFTIHLDGNTMRQIREEVAAVSHEHLETGGYLFGHYPAEEKRRARGVHNRRRGGITPRAA